jgi:alkylhydroperoxidase family enzyme
MHLPYTPNPPPTSSGEEEEILARALQRRAPNGLNALDLTLLHSFPLTAGWSSFIGAIRAQMSLPAHIREVAFLRVAALTGAWYEWDIHAPIAMEAGISVKCLQVIKGVEGGMAGLSDEQMAVMRYADAMTIGGGVGGEVVERVRRFLGEKGTVELTGCIAGFNCVCRFVVALDVGECNGKGREVGRS